jgi:dTDP-3-amino-3,4,6-trideoxy-alpha-D-glucose transaminase
MNLAAFWTRQHAIGVASGLDAIEISLRILGCRAGDRVLTSPISAFATVLAIVKLGAIPVFADCDRYGLIDLEACRELLKRNSAIRYFVPVHLYGHAMDLVELRNLRDEFDLKVVEDCAQSIGARSNGVPTGSAGQLAATSFYPTKNLGALGDGGAILTDSAEGAAQARKLRDYGQSRKYVHDTIGYNSRLDELQAAFLDRAFLPRLDGWIERRRRIARRYCEEIDNRNIVVPGRPAGSESAWHLFPVTVAADRKADLRRHLQLHEIQTGEHYPIALIEQPALRDVPVEAPDDCTSARRFCHGELSLPIHPYLSDDEVSRVIAASNSWSG